VSAAWHCDYDDCDAWARQGSDGARDWFVITSPRNAARRAWHFCSRDHLMLWDRWILT
jgi:hypothetical protein